MRLFPDRDADVVVMGNATRYDHRRIGLAAFEALGPVRLTGAE